MITEDYVSFETAKLLKEKGFDEMCIGFYIPQKELHLTSLGETNSMWLDDSISAPTLQMTTKWLREVHKQPINVWYDGDAWTSEIYRTTERDFCLIGHYKTYEEACEAAIKYCLVNLI